jgi:tRNA-modifying protein YgfZ
MSDLSAREQFLALERGEAVMAGLRDVIVATGPDTDKFLQGQLSQDVVLLEVGQSRLTLHLQPNGRVIAVARLTRIDAETIVIDTEAGGGQQMHAALSRFLIRTKCALTLTEAMPWCVRPTEPDARLNDVEESVASSGELFPLTVRSCLPLTGRDILGSTPELGIVVVDDDVAEAFRISAGVLRLGNELSEATIPSETNLIDDAVTFGKGCYVGQELVERIDSRGRIVRCFRRLESVDVDATLPALTASLTEVNSETGESVEVGHLTSVVRHPVSGRVAAIGLVRARIEVGSSVSVNVDGRSVDFVLLS